MRQLKVFADERWAAFCAQCGATPTTRDHVPPRVFLDRPYPKNLPVVGCCAACNEGASMDEEYLACLVGVAIAGAAKPSAVARPKIARLLEAKPRLAARLVGARRIGADGPEFLPETERLSRVVLKLARGHVAYECGGRKLEKPRHIGYVPVARLHDPKACEAALPADVYPEIGSRAMQRLVESGRDDWQVVQDGRYRYLVTGAGQVVRGVLSEYLAYEVIW